MSHEEHQTELPIEFTKQLISDHLRLSFYPWLFNKYFMQAQGNVYRRMALYCKDYCGGYWDFYRVGERSGYVALQSEETFTLEIPTNGFCGEVSADAAGIIVTLFEMCHCFNRAYSEENDAVCDYFRDAMDTLKYYAEQHPESRLIFAAIN